MTIREFWHDIRERLSDDHHPRREWREERGRDWDRDRWQRSMPDTDERWRQRERGFGARDRGSEDDWSSRRFFRDSSGMTSASYDPDVWTGQTWSADERSANWRERQIDDYGLYAAGYTELGVPDRYTSTTLYGIGYRGRGPQNWSRSDDRIREDICELMTEDEDLDPSDVEVQVKDGEVTLAGTVESRQDKRHAEELAERVSGVRNVHNRLQVHRGRDTFLGTRDALAGSPMGSSTRQ